MGESFGSYPKKGSIKSKVTPEMGYICGKSTSRSVFSVVTPRSGNHLNIIAQG